MKKINLLLVTGALLAMTSCEVPVTSEEISSIIEGLQSTNPIEVVKSIDIVKDEISIDELEVLVGDEFTLSGMANDNLSAYLTWSSSNEEVISIDENGKVSVVGPGQCIISVKVTDLPYITDSIYVSATRKVEQLGVGSGKTKNDPIFLGNEGEDEPIEIYFIEMQHIYADSLFIKKGNVEVLIDTGYEYDGQFVNKVLEEHCSDNRLDLFMLSHSDGDHIDGIPSALTAIDDISLMVDYGGATVSGTNTAYVRNTFTDKGMTYHSAYDCVNKLNGATDRYYLTSEFYFDVLNTGNYVTSDASSAGNGKSVAVIFHYKDFSFFTAGDLTSASEADLIRNEDLPEVTLYKASHHGSHGSNSQELLDLLNPKGVAISAARANYYSAKPGAPSENNTYNLNGAGGHPAAAAIERIYKAPNISRNLNVYWNAVNGTMKFTSYGEDSFEFTGSPTMKGYYDLTLTNGAPVWNETLQDFENRVTGEENFRLHETKVFQFRDYVQYLPQWAKDEYFPSTN